MKSTSLFKLFILISALFIQLSFAQQSPEQEVNTLFTTPEERAYLDFLREEFLLTNQANDFNIDEVVPVVPVIDEVADAPAISSYTLGGIFTRQDGTRTVWLNGVNIEENNLPANMRLVASDNATLLAIQLDSGRFDLRAGQTLDVVNSQILESWQLTNPDQTNDLVESAPAIINDDSQEQNQPVQLEDSSDIILSDASELADPLPELNTETIVLSAEEISTIINSEDPEVLTEFLQTLQNFEEVQIDDDAQ